MPDNDNADLPIINNNHIPDGQKVLQRSTKIYKKKRDGSPQPDAGSQGHCIVVPRKYPRRQIEADKTLVDQDGKQRFFRILDALCKIQCTPYEIMSVLEVSRYQLEMACERNYNMSFAAYREEKSAGGKASLRRMQWRSALSGNVQMQIWLGKNVLGQKDTQRIEQKLLFERDVQIAQKAIEANPELIDALFPAEISHDADGE